MLNVILMGFEKSWWLWLPLLIVTVICAVLEIVWSPKRRNGGK